MRHRRMTIPDKLTSLALAIRRELKDPPESIDGQAERSVRIGALLMAAQTLMTADRWDGWVAGIDGLTSSASRRHIAATNAHRERLAAQSGPLPAYMPSGHELVVFEDARRSTDWLFAVVGRVDRGFHVTVIHVDHTTETDRPVAWAGVSAVLAHAGEGHLREEAWTWYFTPASVTRAIVDAMAGLRPAS